MTLHRRRFLIGFGAMAAVFATTRITRAQPVFSLPSGDLGNEGALYRFRIEPDEFGPVQCTAAVLPRRSFRARIVERRERLGASHAVENIARASGARVAINGGTFNGAFQPDGLLIVDGKTISQKRADWMGMLTIDDAGIASVTAKPHLHSARYALQGHPMIVEPGGKMGMWREDHKRFRRSIIAQSGDLIIAMVTSRISLFSLAYTLIEHPDALYLPSVDAALNLSGAATTSFYAKLLDGTEIIEPAYWPNRDVVTFHTPETV